MNAIALTHPIPDDALDSDIAIVAKKGSGKSYTAKGIVERLLQMGRRVLVLDPLSIWWGLKSSADGERAGFPVAVFGGPHGDMPLTESMGRPLAAIIARENLPAVIDMGQMTKSAWQRLVADLLEELFKLNRDPLWIVLEEADVFAPQQPREGDSTRVLGEVDRIARRGRAFGFRLISITQRPAKLNKDVLTQLSTLVALRTTSPQDRDALKAWVEGNADRDKQKEVVESLQSLAVGEGWVWSPDHDILMRTRFPRILTLDTSATPKAGERRIEPKTLADVDLSAVRAALAVPASTEKAKSNAPDPAAVEKARAEGFAAGLIEGEKRGRAVGIALGISRARTAIDALRVPEIADSVGPDLHEASAKVLTKIITPAMRKAIRAEGPGGIVPGTPVVDRGALNSAGKKMLAVLDTNPPVKRTWTQVATLAGLKARGGHFNAGKKALMDGRLIVETGGLVSIAAPSGNAQPEIRDPAALVDTWAAAVGGAGAKILRHLFDDGGVATKHDIGLALGMATHGGHWNAGVKALRDNDVIKVDGDVFTLTELFQPED